MEERVYATIKSVYNKPPLKVNEFRLNENDYAKIREKALEPSSFATDTMRSRPFQTGPYRGFKIVSPGGLIHTLYVIGPGALPDLNLFARILQSMGIEKAYTIYHFLSPAKRRFPPIGQPVEREHINGGYCMACKPETIVIYRAEDAVRVLIHELQHAACCDNHDEPVPIVEAKTEAWAELIYAMFMAVVHRISPLHAWAIQSGWSVGQNNKLRTHYAVTGPQAYAWRYTVGKEDVWKSWNLPLGPPITNNGSSRGKASLRVRTPNLGLGVRSLMLGAPEQLFTIK